MTPEDIKLITAEYKAKYPQIKQADIDKHLRICELKDLNPILREAFLQENWVKGGGKAYTTVTQIDGFRKIARLDGACGQSAPRLSFNDDGEIVSAELTVYRWANGEYSGPDTPKEEYSAIAFFEEYVSRTKDGKVFGNWARMPVVMVCKCCEALAKRQAHPALAGLYTTDEMGQANNHEPSRPRESPSRSSDEAAERLLAAVAVTLPPLPPKETSNEGTPTPAPPSKPKAGRKKKQVAPSTEAAPSNTQPPKDTAPGKAFRKEIGAHFRRLGLSNAIAMQDVARDLVGKEYIDLTDEDLAKLLQSLELCADKEALDMVIEGLKEKRS